MDVHTAAKAHARSLAVIAQNEAIWAFFVRSGQAGHIDSALLRQAQADLEQRMALEVDANGSRERRLRGAARIRGYLAEHAQP